MTILELNHVALAVSDVEKSVQFYRDILGLPVLPRPEFPFPGAWFRLGKGQELHLIGGRFVAPVEGGSRGGHFALRTTDLDAAAVHLKKHAVPFRGPSNRPDGAIQIFLTDPDGHTVELCTNLPG